MNAPLDMVVDHINGNPLDNRKCNLRIVTIDQNMENRRGAQSNSKSKIRGVYWDKFNEQWHCQIEKNGVKVFSKRFDCIKEAENAAINKRKELGFLDNGL